MSETTIKWVKSPGGPFLLLPEELLGQWWGTEVPDEDDEEVTADFRWDGPDSAATDYDRACDVVGDLAMIRIGEGWGVVLNVGQKHFAALVSLSDESALVVEHLQGETRELEPHLRLVQRRHFAQPEVFFDVRRDMLWLAHAGCGGDYLKNTPFSSSIVRQPGQYSLAEGDIDIPGDAELVVHWLQREGPAGEPCAAERDCPKAQPLVTAVAAEDEPLFRVQIEGKSGFINQRGELVISPQFTHVADFLHSRAPFQKDGLFGYIDPRGDVVIPCAYDLAEGFYDGVARVRLAGIDEYINRQGEIAFECPFALATSFSEDAPVSRLNVMTVIAGATLPLTEPS